MVPRLDSAEQAREAVTFLRYPPDGIRGVATRVRGAGLGVVGHGDIHRLNERVVGIIQIESVGGLRDADKIAAIDGVDVLFVGPADLSHSLGIPGQFGHADYLAALDRVVAACRAHGKAAGILLYDAAIIPGYVDRGFSFVGIGADAPSPWRGRDARWRRSARSPRPLRPGGPAPVAARRRAAPRARVSPAVARRSGRSATPTTINAPPTSWIGARTSSRKPAARATMISGSTVLTSAAWAAPIRRAPA